MPTRQSPDKALLKHRLMISDAKMPPIYCLRHVWVLYSEEQNPPLRAVSFQSLYPAQRMQYDASLLLFFQ